MGFSAAALLFATVAGAQETAQSVTVSVVAVQATHENRGEKKHFDSALKDVRGALAPLDFDTFRHLQSARLNAELNDEKPFRINDDYTLYVKPLSVDAQGRVQLSARVTMKAKDPREPPRTALSTTFSIAPGKRFNLGGLRLEKGELILVLAARK